MKINLLVRIKNPTFWVSFLPTVIAFVYSVFSWFGITPKISQNSILSALSATVSALAALGILVDPTTAGISDSDRAMGYSSPA